MIAKVDNFCQMPASHVDNAMVSSSVGPVHEDKLGNAWQDHTMYHTHGSLTTGQQLGDELQRHTVQVQEPLQEMPVVISCQKGMKGVHDISPNQDNFSITYFKSGHAMACCFDGHGEYGHLVSTRTVQTVPYFFLSSKSFPDDVPDALTDAFEKAQMDVIEFARRDGWDICGSGSTAVVAVWKGSQVWTANAGDSRCVIGSIEKSKTLFETADHKPELPEERSRIEHSGGEVRTLCYDDGVKISRIYVKGTDFPGLCMSRSLGDLAVKPHGVIAAPEISVHEVDLSQSPFLLLASDGVWEFLDTNTSVKTIVKKMQDDGPAKRVQKLQREARKRWRQEEGSYCDDITSILVRLHHDSPFSCPPSGLSAVATDETGTSNDDYAAAATKPTVNTSDANAQLEDQSYAGIKACMEQSYADLRARMVDYTKQPSAERKKLMEESCAELKAQMAQLHKPSSPRTSSISTTSAATSDTTSQTSCELRAPI